MLTSIKSNVKKHISGYVFFTGLLFMLIGIFIREEHIIVLNKAIRICMECIGIG